MRHAFALLGFLYAGAVLCAADPTPAPVPAGIRLPAVVTPTPPAPMPNVDAPLKVTAGTIFAVESDAAIISLCSPAGLVTFTQEAGPLRIRGVFADSKTGKPETRTFTAKFVTLVDASHSGRGELFFIPAGAESADKIVRRTADVDAGEAPKPPQPGPAPLTALEAKLKAAAAADGAGKPALLTYAALYRTAAGSTVDDAGLTTGAALLGEMQRAVKSLGLPPGSLNATARAVADELDKTLATIATLDAPARAAAKSAFLSVATALEVVANGN